MHYVQCNDENIAFVENQDVKTLILLMRRLYTTPKLLEKCSFRFWHYSIRSAKTAIRAPLIYSNKCDVVAVNKPLLLAANFLRILQLSH